MATEIKHVNIVITNNIATTGEIHVAGASGGVIVLPNTFNSTSLAIHVNDGGANWYPLYNASNAAVSITVQGNRAYELPAQAFLASRIRILGNQDSSAFSCPVILKSI